MKWLFFLLLLANIGVFIWAYPQQQVSRSSHLNSDGVATLILLSEVPEEAERQSEQKSDTLNDLPAEVTEEPATPATSEESLTPRPEPAQTIVADSGEISGEVTPEPVLEKGLEEEKTEAGPPDVAVLEPQISKPIIPPEEEIATTEEPEQVLVDTTACVSIGPLPKRAMVDTLSIRLLAMDVKTRLKTESVKEQAGYWVVVPPQKDRAAAVATVKRLKGAGVTDLWRFTSGELAHAISLGLFRNEGRAEARKTLIADKGFNVEVRPRVRKQSSYRLEYSYKNTPPISGDKWGSLTQAFPGIERNVIDCGNVATSGIKE
ncbi:MAG: hypothetical protein DIZ77_08450 [endosymbiont of Seepiophila jonesi]|uniref:SPOR domain-containing protein n=1 Tax=endosymbiont of Lamellibrachia luymesi TaxID=2200907 RepID=A0A370E099_9GAMM|nr:MAG: hypothetical protein DIZ77_08450 [endosymbiont of Seepiophila jonesi]RDH92605.1 MAG: hypothetical protein DIZ79_02885 [endosymbiont of Lamellibrachia luymesi]